MRGPGAKGMAEVAVSRVKGSGPETPDLENFPVNDFDNNSEVSDSWSNPEKYCRKQNCQFNSSQLITVEPLTLKSPNKNCSR